MMKQFVFGKQPKAVMDYKSDINYNLAKHIFPGNNLKKAYSGMVGDIAASGGELVPTPLADRFIDLVKEKTWTRQIFRSMAMRSATLEIPVKTALESTYRVNAGAEWLSEGGADGASTMYSRGTWDSILLTADKFGSLGGYTTELYEDSPFNIAEIVLAGLSRSMAEAEEKSFLQGDNTGTITAWDAGDVRKSFDGMIWHVNGTAASTGGNWTPAASTATMSRDGGSNTLSAQELNNLLADIEDQGFECDYIAMRPKTRARMRDATEFEQLQTLKDLGAQAALIKGFVGKYYTANLLTSTLLPIGTTFGTAADDSLVLGFDSSQPLIGDRRRIEIRKRHRFYQDIEEIRLTERIAFDVELPLSIGLIADVKDSA